MDATPPVPLPLDGVLNHAICAGKAFRHGCTDGEPEGLGLETTAWPSPRHVNPRWSDT
jgi:hypothetical protein